MGKVSSTGQESSRIAPAPSILLALQDRCRLASRLNASARHIAWRRCRVSSIRRKLFLHQGHPRVVGGRNQACRHIRPLGKRCRLHSWRMVANFQYSFSTPFTSSTSKVSTCTFGVLKVSRHFKSISRIANTLITHSFQSASSIEI